MIERDLWACATFFGVFLLAWLSLEVWALKCRRATERPKTAPRGGDPL